MTPYHLLVRVCGVCALYMRVLSASYFWVFVKFVGMTLRQGVLLLTLGTAAMGVAACVVVWCLSLSPVVALTAMMVLWGCTAVVRLAVAKTCPAAADRCPCSSAPVTRVVVSRTTAHGGHGQAQQRL